MSTFGCCREQQQRAVFGVDQEVVDEHSHETPRSAALNSCSAARMPMLSVLQMNTARRSISLRAVSATHDQSALLRLFRGCTCRSACPSVLRIGAARRNPLAKQLRVKRDSGEGQQDDSAEFRQSHQRAYGRGELTQQCTTILRRAWTPLVHILTAFIGTSLRVESPIGLRCLIATERRRA